MKKHNKKILKDLSDYGTLYYLVGVVEVTLRERMIMTLRNLALQRNRGEWFAVLPEEKQFNDFLARAIIHKIRNRVAHYDFKGSGEFVYEKEILIWFIQALGK